MISFLTHVPGEIAIVPAVAALTMLRHRMSRERPLNLRRQWGILSLCLAAGAASLCVTRLSPCVWLWSLLAMAIGGLLGCLRARTVIVSLDDTGRLMQTRPPNSFWVLILILCLRPVIHGILSHELGPNVTHAGATVVAFAVGTIVAGRVELTVRALRLRRQTRCTA